jgi:lysosomal acid lipase/cholesteryl ester hydrolase
MGVYDLPAAIDYVLEQTSQPDLYYIGHSMGTTMFFVLTSTLTEYNAKIRLMTALAPIAYMAFVKSPISKFFGANPLTKVFLC